MSEYIRTKTQFKAEHLDCLAAALGDVEPGWRGKIEVHPEGATIRDFHGRELPAVLVIRRAAAGGYGDFGFATRTDFTLEMVADDGHRRRLTDAWAGRLTQAYAFRVAEKQAAKSGLSATKTVQPDGSWRVVLSKKRPVLAGRSW